MEKKKKREKKELQKQIHTHTQKKIATKIQNISELSKLSKHMRERRERERDFSQALMFMVNFFHFNGNEKNLLISIKVKLLNLHIGV